MEEWKKVEEDGRRWKVKMRRRRSPVVASNCA
jgi:hypothetical protein